MNQKFHRKQIYSIEIRFFSSFFDFFVQLFLVPSFDSCACSFSMKWDRKQQKKERKPHYNMAFVTTMCTLARVLLHSNSKWELMWCNQGTVIHTKSTEQLCALTNSFIYISISYALPTHFHASVTFCSFFLPVGVCIRHGPVAALCYFHFYNGNITPAAHKKEIQLFVAYTDPISLSIWIHKRVNGWREKASERMEWIRFYSKEVDKFRFVVCLRSTQNCCISPLSTFVSSI